MNYAESLQFIADRSPVFAGKKLYITVVQNPTAGGFSIQKLRMQHDAVWKEYVQKLATVSPVTELSVLTERQTTCKGDAATFTKEILYTVQSAQKNELHLIVTAGGDGTSQEVQAELAYAFCGGTIYDEQLRHLCILRLPMGTGNDGSDGHTLGKSLDMLLHAKSISRTPAVSVSTARGDVWYSFNITSIGLDAFVTNMTNRVKRIVPGNFYKIWVDLACLFYRTLYKIASMHITAYNDAVKVREFNEKFTLFLMGVSGFRTYGSGQKILPDIRNVCGVRDMSVLQKLKLKKRFLTGSHAKFPQTELCTATAVTIEYSEPILVQMDGEAHLLQPEDFPLVMKLTESFLPVMPRIIDTTSEGMLQ